MNESVSRYSLRRWLVAIGLFYLLNVLAVVAANWNIGQIISHGFGWQGHLRVGLQNAIVMGAVGLVLGQSGCAAVWFTVSRLKLIYRIPIYLFVISQLALVLVLQMIDHSPQGQLWSHFPLLLGISVVFLAITFSAVRLSGMRMHLVPTDQAEVGKAYGSISITQCVFFTAVVAVTLVVTSAGSPLNNTLRTVLTSIQIGLVIGLLPFAGLMVAISVRRLPVQMVACIGLACIVCAFVAIVMKRWETFQRFGPGMSLIALVPVLWLRVLERMGYFIRCIESKPKEVAAHPFTEEDAAMEPGV